MPAVFIALITLAGVITSAIVGYFVAKLTNSGKIDTSTADRLWEEAGKLRVALGEQLTASGVREAAKDVELQRLTNEASDLRQRLAKAEGEIETLRSKVAHVEDEQERRRLIDERK